MVEFRGIPAILMMFTKKASETAFLVKSHHETHFYCPGPLKIHRKSTGFVGVCAPGPPKHDFHPTGLKIGENHTIFMKCGENHYIITKMWYFGRNPAKGGNTLPRTLLNQCFYSLPWSPPGHAIPTFLYFFMWKDGKSCNSREFEAKSQFHVKFRGNHTFTPKITYETHWFRWCLRPPARQGPTFT